MHNLFFIEGQELVIVLIQSGCMVHKTAADYWGDSLNYETNVLIHKFLGFCSEPTSSPCSDMQFPAPQT